MLEHRIITVSDISNLDLDYTPTSVFLNGIQTFAYKIQSNIIYFDMVLAMGTEIVLTPPTAIRSLNDSIETVTIDIIGRCSVCSDPIGAIEFSTDGATWVKSLVGVFPATVYCRPGPHDVVLDCTCKVDADIVIWQGGDYASITTDGTIDITVPVGGVEYELY